MEHENYMREALLLAREAAAEGEVPVGCVIVKDGRVIGRGRNRREAGKTALAHAELEAIHQVCRQYQLRLYLDGARLGYGLMADGTDLTLPEIARLCDVFYIGGTKHGALFGEAVVIKNDAIKKDFRYIIKQHGGMFAKGRLLGLQFDTLFTDGLYYKIGRREVAQTAKLRAAFEAKGIEFAYPSPTNQLFPILSKPQLDALREKYSFSVQSVLPDGGAVVRFCTSWATTQAEVDALLDDIAGL